MVDNVRWGIWRPWYKEIVARLNLDERADRAAAKILNCLLPEPDLKKFIRLLQRQECIVFGAGPSLDEDLKKLQRMGYLNKVLIAADGATSAVIKYRNPDIVVTDLDGDIGDQLEGWRCGSWLVIHAHGDNIAQVRGILPKLNERTIGTTQVKPFGILCNFGGFTDGDRAAFMAHELGASKIYLAGMDLGTRLGRYSGIKDTNRKLVKLKICKELLSWLAGELGANLVNLTTDGEDIPNVPRTT
jgi:hypothetical protein